MDASQSLRSYHQQLSHHLSHLLKRVNDTYPSSPQSSSSKTSSVTPPVLPERTTTSTSNGSNTTLISSVSSSAESRAVQSTRPIPGESTDSASGSPLSQDDVSKDPTISTATSVSVPPQQNATGKQRMSSYGADSGAIEVLKEDEEEDEELSFPAQERTARPEFVPRSSNLISQELLVNPVSLNKLPTIRVSSSTSKHHPSTVPTLRDAQSEERVEADNGEEETESPVAEITSSSPTNDDPTPTVDGQSETLSREEEHARAWRTDGRRVWKILPDGFQLSLDGTSKRRRSNDSAQPSGFCTPCEEVCVSGRPVSSIGLGLGVCAEDDGTPRKCERRTVDEDDVEITPQPKSHAAMVSPEVPSSSPRHNETLNHKSSGYLKSVSLKVNRPSSYQTASPSGIQVSPSQSFYSLAKSSLPSVPNGIKRDMSNTPSIGHKYASEIGSSSQGKRSTEGEKKTKEKEDEYERRRLAKLRKHEKQLNDRVGRWLGGLDAELEMQSPPEIHPNIPSPSLTTTLLRFEPLPSGFPPQDSSKTYNLLPRRRLTSLPNDDDNLPLVNGNFIKLSDLSTVSQAHTPAELASTPSEHKASMASIAATKKAKRLGLGGRLTDLDIEIAIRVQAMEALALGGSAGLNGRRA